MSGGSYDYVCWKLHDFAEALQLKNNPRRIAFKKLVKLVADAAHAIEWVDSGDCGDGHEHESIDAILSFLKADPTVIAKANAFDEFKEIVSKYLNLVPDKRE